MSEYLVDCRRVQFAAVRVEADSEQAAIEKVQAGYSGSGAPLGYLYWEDDTFEAFDAEKEEA